MSQSVSSKEPTHLQCDSSALSHQSTDPLSSNEQKDFPPLSLGSKTYMTNETKSEYMESSNNERNKNQLKLIALDDPLKASRLSATLLLHCQFTPRDTAALLKLHHLAASPPSRKQQLLGGAGEKENKAAEEARLAQKAADEDSSLDEKTPEEIEAKKLADNGTINQIIPNKSNTPLTDAAGNNKLDMVKALLKFADVNAKDANGSTPLYKASRWGHVKMVELLLGAEGIDVNATDNDGWTPLHLASGSGYVEVIKVLLGAEGIDVNAIDKDGWTPLYTASNRGHVEAVKMLLGAEGIDVNAEEKNCTTALSYAISKGHSEIVALLRSAGATE